MRNLRECMELIGDLAFSLYDLISLQQASDHLKTNGFILKPITKITHLIERKAEARKRSQSSTITQNQMGQDGNHRSTGVLKPMLTF